MSGLSDLAQLLSRLEPVLHDAPYAFALTPSPIAGAFAHVGEEEGLTVVARAALLVEAGIDPGPAFARISLTVHSDLAAVGLTAAMARELADRQISANVVAGFYHDHVFVPWDRRHDAISALQELSHG